MVPSLAVFLTLMREVGKSSNESAAEAVSERCVKGKAVACLPILVPLLATPTCLVEGWMIGSLAE